MGLQRTLVDVLDRRGARWLLARLATTYAATVLKSPVTVRYDGHWIRELPDGRVLVDSSRFPHFADTLARSASDADRIESAARHYWFHVYTPAPGDVIVDVGAGDGTETGVFSRAVGPEGRVYAIEAHPATYARLEKAVKLNGWKNVVPVHAAIVDTARTVYIEDRQRDLSNAVSLASDNSHAAAVPGLSLDEFCAQHGIEAIDFLKMNIEGAERLALQGMGRTIRMAAVACIACHDFRSTIEGDESFSTKADVVAFLEEHGLQIHLRDDATRRFLRDHVHAVSPLLRPGRVG